MTERINICPKCDEPVVFTFEFPGAEYYCPSCEWRGGVMMQDTAVATPMLAHRAGIAKREYEEARAAREGRPVREPEPDGPRPTCSGCGKTADGPMDGDKPSHWYKRTIDHVDEYACSRDCIATGVVAPW